jgi:hypothetical protein
VIDSLDQSLERLLREKVPLPAGSTVAFDPPTQEWADGRDRLTVNLYLYDVRENHELRSPVWTTETLPDGTLTKVRPVARIDLFYLVTAWSGATPRDVLEAHRVLGNVLRTLLRFPTLPPELLQGELVGQEPPLPTLVAQPDGPPNPADLWSALGNRLNPALTLVVTISMRPSAYLDVPTRLVPAASRSLLFGSGITSTFRLGVRPPLGEDHTQDEPVTWAQVEAAVAAHLLTAVYPSARSLTVLEGRNIPANAWVVVSDGDNSDFVFVRAAPGAGEQTIPVDPPLRFPHAAGTAIGGVTVAALAVTSLTGPAAAGTQTISVANGNGLATGAWLLIEDAGRSEVVRLAANGAAGPMVLPLRRPLAFDHGAGRGLRPVTLTPGPPITTLRDPVRQPGATVQLDAAGTLTQGAVVMVGSGADTELSRLGAIPAGPNPVVGVQPSLRSNHPAGTPLRRVTDVGPVGTLALRVEKGMTEVTVTGERAGRLHPGDVIRLGQTPTAYHQATSVIADPAGATRIGEILVQIGGTVTDDQDPPAAIPGARVELVDLHLAATTDAEGRFVFTNLSPTDATLTLRVAATGYQELAKGVRVPAQTRDEYRIRLSAA